MIFSRRSLLTVSLLVLTAALGCATLPGSPPEENTGLPEDHPDISSMHTGLRDPRADAYAGYMMGLLLADEGQFDRALNYLEMSAALDSSSPAALIQIMRIYAETDQREKAEQTGRKVLDIHPDTAEVHLALGQILLESNRDGEALDHLRKGIQLGPENTSALFLLAEALERTGDEAGALETLEKLAGTEGHEALANYYIARLRVKSGDIIGAVDPLVKAVELNPSFLKAVGELGEQLHKDGRSDDAVDLFQGFLDRDPGSDPVREFLAKILLIQERYDEARSQLDVILEKNSGNTGALLLLGLVEARDGNSGKALELFNRVRKTSGDTFEVLMQIGTLQRELEMLAEAQASFEEASRINPDRYEPYLNLAVLHDEAGDIEEAVKNAEKALSLEPWRSNIRAYLAQVLTREERYEEALDLLNEGLREVPNDTTLLYQLGITHDRNGQFDLTVDALERLLKVNPNHPDALNYLGYSWADRGMNLERALELVEKALRIRPDAAYIIDSLGWVYFKMGRYEEALVLLLKAGEKMSDDPTVLDHIGDTYEQLGQKDLAVQYWTRALAADPGNTDIERKLREKGAVKTDP